MVWHSFLAFDGKEENSQPLFLDNLLSEKEFYHEYTTLELNLDLHNQSHC